MTIGFAEVNVIWILQNCVSVYSKSYSHLVRAVQDACHRWSDKSALSAVLLPVEACACMISRDSDCVQW